MIHIKRINELINESYGSGIVNDIENGYTPYILCKEPFEYYYDSSLDRLEEYKNELTSSNISCVFKLEKEINGKIVYNYVYTMHEPVISHAGDYELDMFCLLDDYIDGKFAIERFINKYTVGTYMGKNNLCKIFNEIISLPFEDFGDVNDFVYEQNQTKSPETLKEPETFEENIATNVSIGKLVRDAIKKYGNNANLNFINTSQVTDMSMLFYFSSFNGDISQWDVSNVKNMEKMFYQSKFNGDISQWNVSRVENMSFMFYNSKFNGDISQWNVSNVKRMLGMFDETPLYYKPPKWYKK